MLWPLGGPGLRSVGTNPPRAVEVAEMERELWDGGERQLPGRGGGW